VKPSTLTREALLLGRRGGGASGPLAALFAALMLLACDQTLSVSRVDESFSVGQADGAMFKATDVLQSQDTGFDVSCPVRLLRQGASVPYIARTNKIWSDADVKATFDLPGYVKVVHLINRCGKTSSATIIGCAPLGRPTMIVEDLKDNDGPNVALEGPLWAHEFGHSQGLRHTPPPFCPINCEGPTCFNECDVFGIPQDTSAFVMSAGINTGSRSITSAECNAFLVPRKAPPAPPSAPCEVCEVICYNQCNLGFAGHGEAAATLGPKVPIREFVGRVYVDSVPFAEAMRYGPEEIPQLTAMLADPREREGWSMVATVLGIIGSDRDAATLINFIRKDRPGRLDGSEYRSVGAAIVALGYMVERSGSPTAMGFLAEASQPRFWARQTRMRWTSRFTATRAERDSDLRNFSIMALGLTGSAQAWPILQGLWSDLNRGLDVGNPTEKQALMALVEQAMDDHGRVSGHGLAVYYGN
jgi:hypothetical protein